MRAIATNLKENRKSLLAVMFIQISTAVGCYLLIPKIFT
jgi:hypothetical protein